MQTLPPNPLANGAFRSASLMVQLGAACLLGGLLTAGIASGAHWASGNTQAIATAAVTSTGLWLLASLAGLLMLNAITRGNPAKVAFGVLIASAARMLAALALGLLLYFLMTLDGRTFWAAFLLTGLCCLLAETAWALRTNNAARATPGAASGVH